MKLRQPSDLFMGIFGLASGWLFVNVGMIIACERISVTSGFILVAGGLGSLYWGVRFFNRHKQRKAQRVCTHSPTGRHEYVQLVDGDTYWYGCLHCDAETVDDPPKDGEVVA